MKNDVWGWHVNNEKKNLWDDYVYNRGGSREGEGGSSESLQSKITLYI